MDSKLAVGLDAGNHPETTAPAGLVSFSGADTQPYIYTCTKGERKRMQVGSDWGTGGDSSAPCLPLSSPKTIGLPARMVCLSPWSDDSVEGGCSCIFSSYLIQMPNKQQGESP